jgi:hypothetical protein
MASVNVLGVRSWGNRCLFIGIRCPWAVSVPRRGSAEAFVIWPADVSFPLLPVAGLPPISEAPTPDALFRPPYQETSLLTVLASSRHRNSSR